jgi:hypothetical protein
MGQAIHAIRSRSSWFLCPEPRLNPSMSTAATQIVVVIARVPATRGDAECRASRCMELDRHRHKMS